MVYCIGNRKDRTCKIGFTTRNVEERLAELRPIHGSDIVFFGGIHGLRKEEKELHKQFKAHNRSGEWFNLVPEIAEVFGFNIDEPERLWISHMKFVDKSVAGEVIYSDYMCTAFAPTRQEAAIVAKQRAKASPNPPKGYCVEQMVLCVPYPDIEKAHGLIPNP